MPDYLQFFLFTTGLVVYACLGLAILRKVDRYVDNDELLFATAAFLIVIVPLTVVLYFSEYCLL